MLNLLIPSPVLIDFFCCGGGASKGYADAGFSVYGVDNAPQPHYPYPFRRESALDVLDDLLAGRAVYFVGREDSRWITLDDVAAFVGSPPCQGHTSLRHRTGKTYLDLIPDTRERFQASGKPWIIENVVGAPLVDPVRLCGTMFDLGATCLDGVYRQLRRHRLFESNAPISAPRPCAHEGQPVGVYGHGGNSANQRGYSGVFSERKEALGIDWLPSKALSQALPPAYTEHLGRQLLAAL